MIAAWRIVKAKYQSGAFDGEGARLGGGRWNSPGARMVYTAESAALAVLEILVHIGNASILPAYVLVSCSFDEQLVSSLDRSLLPADWRTYPAPAQLQLLGDTWIREGRTAVLKVPSVIIETESNYLLNPLHSDFASVAIGPGQPFEIDERLFRR